MQRSEEQQQQQQQLVAVHNNSSRSVSFNSSLSLKEDDEMSKSALFTFRAKEEEIERKKMDVAERLRLQLNRVEEETKRLAIVREELETLSDPMKKEVSKIRKKVDAVNKELKALGIACQKKEKEYKEALEAFNDRNKEKVQLITKLMEMVNESERSRLNRLEELNRKVGDYMLTYN